MNIAAIIEIALDTSTPVLARSEDFNANNVKLFSHGKYRVKTVCVPNARP
jgi:hypothetical protein